MIIYEYFPHPQLAIIQFRKHLRQQLLHKGHHKVWCRAQHKGIQKHAQQLLKEAYEVLLQ